MAKLIPYSNTSTSSETKLGHGYANPLAKSGVAGDKTELNTEISLKIQQLVEEKVQSHTEDIKKDFQNQLREQQKETYVLLTILTAVLAFISTQATILSKADSNVVVAVSCIMTGVMLLFVYLIFFVLKSSTALPKPFIGVAVFLIIGGVCLTSWSPKDIYQNAHNLIVSFNDEEKSSNK